MSLLNKLHHPKIIPVINNYFVFHSNKINQALIKIAIINSHQFQAFYSGRNDISYQKHAMKLPLTGHTISTYS